MAFTRVMLKSAVEADYVCLVSDCCVCCDIMLALISQKKTFCIFLQNQKYYFTFLQNCARSCTWSPGKERAPSCPRLTIKTQAGEVSDRAAVVINL